jgi:hypothetical protein
VRVTYTANRAEWLMRETTISIGDPSEITTGSAEASRWARPASS